MQNVTSRSPSHAPWVYFRIGIQLFVDHDNRDRPCVPVDSANNGAYSHRTKANECKLCDPAVVMMMGREGCLGVP
jgi:hypothetical protein